MDTELTPEQKAQLATWASQRDAILLEISGLQSRKEKLKKENKELAESYTDIINQKNIVQGRIEELKQKESELPLLISKEIASLQAQKTTLQSEVLDLKELIETLADKKDSLQRDILFAIATFDSVKNETLQLEKIVDHVIKVSEQNKFIVEEMADKIKKSTEEIVAINNKTIKDTNYIVDKVPAMIVELQKTKLIKHRL